MHGFCYILYHVISFPACGKLITIKQRRFTCFKGRSQMEMSCTCFLFSNRMKTASKNTKPHGPPQNLKPNNAERVSIKTTHPTPVENHGVFHPGKGLCFSAWTGRSHWDVSHGRWCLSGNVLGWGGLCQHKLSKRFSLQKIPMFSVRFFLEVKSLSQSRTTMASEFRFFPCLLLTVKRLE